MGFVGQLVRCNILCKKTENFIGNVYLKWNGHFGAAQRLISMGFYSTREKKYKENEDTSPELQEYKSCLPFSLLIFL